MICISICCFSAFLADETANTYANNTPQTIFSLGDSVLCSETGKTVIYLKDNIFEIHPVHIFLNKIKWSAMSNAFLRSTKIPIVKLIFIKIQLNIVMHDK